MTRRVCTGLWRVVCKAQTVRAVDQSSRHGKGSGSPSDGGGGTVSLTCRPPLLEYGFCYSLQLEAGPTRGSQGGRKNQVNWET